MQENHNKEPELDAVPVLFVFDKGRKTALPEGVIEKGGRKEKSQVGRKKGGREGKRAVEKEKMEKPAAIKSMVSE